MSEGVSSGVCSGTGESKCKAVNTAEGARGDQGEIRDMVGAMGMGVHTVREPCSTWARLNFILSEGRCH